ncbi:MAG TPA: methyltransferase domain-containing protein [Segetibacter sp.]|nr:methyltransferase domain-containing protein [Segetibacter sp.]
MLENENYNRYFEANKEGWNKRTQIHKVSEFYDVLSFKAGKSSLNAIELEEVGNVSEKTLLHLQCHFGMDTLSWAREGADVTGIDISNQAIDYAKELSKELNIPARFICCNIYDLPIHLEKKFDTVFTSYGAVGWLPCLDKWASIINYFLKPGGAFYIIEFHPVVWMMDDNFKYIKYAYHNLETIAVLHTGTYTDRNSAIDYEEYSWNHGLSEVVNSLIKYDLQIQHLNEFPFSCYNCFNNVVQGEDGYWRVKGLEDKIPLMYSVKAVKQS